MLPLTLPSPPRGGEGQGEGGQSSVANYASSLFGRPQAGQLPAGLRLIRGDLENVAVLLRGGGPVPGLGGGARQPEAGLDVAGVLAEHAPPLVHRLVVLL